jgi:hypothetical protein
MPTASDRLHFKILQIHLELCSEYQFTCDRKDIMDKMLAKSIPTVCFFWRQSEGGINAS